MHTHIHRSGDIMGEEAEWSQEPKVREECCVTESSGHDIYDALVKSL